MYVCKSLLLFWFRSCPAWLQGIQTVCLCQFKSFILHTILKRHNATLRYKSKAGMFELKSQRRYFIGV